jgi:purine-nucleoside phosphorylase|tara:strand:- start:320 stop:1123 length:804 start_codon:yes stop_codon:yes gene_type:complete
MSQVDDCVGIINQTINGFKPDVGLILGSGLGQFCDNVKTIASIDFGSLPGFPIAGVGGHAGRLLFGQVEDTNVVVMQGRAHYYENGRADIMAVAIQTLSAIGCKSLVLTNAAGSLVKEASPGSVMLITDHINMTGVSPLFGAESNKRFVDMSDAYNPELNDDMRSSAKMNNITLHEGVYAWFSGPQFETPAEIKAVKTLGADAVGMSTVPEVILARHQGLPLCALSVITNYAAGMSETKLSHEQTIAFASKAADTVEKVLISYLKSQ